MHTRFCCFLVRSFDRLAAKKRFCVLLCGFLGFTLPGVYGLLMGVAKERGIDGICLLGEVPLYATRVPNPMAGLAVMRVLTGMLGIEVDLSEMVKMAVEAGERMKQVAAQAMEEYIDYFTEPIWERGEEEDEEDED